MKRLIVVAALAVGACQSVSTDETVTKLLTNDCENVFATVNAEQNVRSSDQLETMVSLACHYGLIDEGAVQHCSIPVDNIELIDPFKEKVILKEKTSALFIAAYGVGQRMAVRQTMALTLSHIDHHDNDLCLSELHDRIPLRQQIRDSFPRLHQLGY
ncbi:MAG: hypothetical protein ACLPN5_07665 [Roseiarcus sp.]